MIAAVDITGHRFGKLVAIKREGKRHGTTMWLCQCDCGVTKTMHLNYLRSGQSKSCGCARTPKIPFDTRIKEGTVVDSNTGCWNWQGNKDAAGYGRVSVSMGSRDKKWTLSTHRMSWIAFNGEIPNGLHVLHRCDNPSCCNPEHLFLGTHQDNMEDMWAKGRHASQKKKAS